MLMHTLRILAVSLVSFAPLVSPAASVAASEPDYVLVHRYEYSSENIDGGGSGSGSGNTALSERILETRGDGIVIEYSIPGDFDKVRGNAMWMYPARVLVAADGTKTLLNADELKARNTEWLESAGWPVEVCGEWTFTWTAVQILCDPQEVIKEIEANDMRPGTLVAGEAITVSGYDAEFVLQEGGTDQGDAVLTATSEIDNDYARRKIAETRVIVGKITGEEISFEQALAEAASITTAGEVQVTLILGKNGLVQRREASSEVTVTGPNYDDERRTNRSTTVRVPYQDWLKQRETLSEP